MGLTAEQAVKRVQKLHGALMARRREVQKLESYYRGEQPLAYASAEWADFHRDRYAGFSDNWCGVVADSPAERLRVGGFRLPSDDASSEVLSTSEAQLWRWWQVNDGDGQSSQGFLTSITSKRSAVLVWGDENDEPELTWEHPSQVYVEYDPERPRRRLAALKVWSRDDLECATLFLPDQVWKFQRPVSPVQVSNGRTAAGLYVDRAVLPALTVGDGGWVPRHPASDDTWPLVNPMGVVSVVEFANRPMLAGGPMSDIAGTMAMQDAINLLWAYLFTAADHASMPARVVMGQEPPRIPILDELGNKIGEKEVALRDLAQGRLLWLTGQNASVSQWDAAKLDTFTDVIETAVGHIAAQTRTPPHYLASNKGLSNLSGDALKAAETGLVKKVQEQQLFYGPQVREVFRLMALAAGDERLAEATATGVTLWKDAESRSEAQLVDALQKLKAIGFPFEWLAERYGLGPTEVANLVAMRQRESADDLLGTLAASLDGSPAPAGATPPA